MGAGESWTCLFNQFTKEPPFLLEAQTLLVPCRDTTHFMILNENTEQTDFFLYTTWKKSRKDLAFRKSSFLYLIKYHISQHHENIIINNRYDFKTFDKRPRMYISTQKKE